MQESIAGDEEAFSTSARFCERHLLHCPPSREEAGQVIKGERVKQAVQGMALAMVGHYSFLSIPDQICLGGTSGLYLKGITLLDLRRQAVGKILRSERS